MKKHNYLGIDYDISEYSFQDFTNWEFVSRDDYDFSDKVIYGSCFSQQEPDTIVFPKSMTGATFIKCNLMNVLIPDGNTIIDCQVQRYKIENDNHAWIVDKDNKPVSILDTKFYLKRGLPLPDPKSIPLEKQVVE